jgi:adenine-specific DNA methylase
MMASYAAGWRRLTPLFSVRAFRHIQRPVEINPWVDGTGRGSFPNSVRRLIRAKEFIASPKEPAIRGGFRAVPVPKTCGSTTVLNQNSQDLSIIPDGSVDIVLTDPPYYDNINYSELSEFFAPWMKELGLTKRAKSTRTVVAQSLVASKRAGKNATGFAAGLGVVFSEIRRILKPHGLAVFTFRHTHADAWASLAAAIHAGGLFTSRVFPMPGEAGTGLHTSDGTGLWDAVFVLRPADAGEVGASLPVSADAVRNASAQVRQWRRQLRRAAIPFTSVDARAMRSALLVAEALRPSKNRRGQSTALLEALNAQ